MCPLELDFTLNQMCPLETMNFNQMWPFSHNFILHGSHSHNLYWIYALLSRNQPCCDYSLWEALFGKIWWEEALKHFNEPGRYVSFNVECVWLRRVLNLKGKLFIAEPFYGKGLSHDLERPGWQVLFLQALNLKGEKWNTEIYCISCTPIVTWAFS